MGVFFYVAVGVHNSCSFVSRPAPAPAPENEESGTELRLTTMYNIAGS